jgi:hypothetical protein
MNESRIRLAQLQAAVDAFLLEGTPQATDYKALSEARQASTNDLAAQKMLAATQGVAQAAKLLLKAQPTPLSKEYFRLKLALQELSNANGLAALFQDDIDD